MATTQGDHEAAVEGTERHTLPEKQGKAFKARAANPSEVEPHTLKSDHQALGPASGQEK